uniref:RING-type domain-containing protein n=1 Tax=Strongyloides papillosus TaxID=174720 RepID=A0A0N5BN46_STREA
MVLINEERNAAKNGKVAKGISVNDGNNDETLSEMDYPYLNEKPNVGRKTEKGRRHAGHAELKKHLSKDAYLSKNVIIDGKIGKREKNRLICETSIDSISANVPYSLNRKNRWNTISPISLNSNVLSSMSEGVTVAVVEQMNTIPDIGCVNEKTKKHLIEGCVTGVTIGNEDGSLTKKVPHSACGANLSSLLKSDVKVKDKKGSETSDLDLNEFEDSNDSMNTRALVRYHINTSHKTTDYSISKHFKQQQKVLKTTQKSGKKNKKQLKKFELDEIGLMSNDEEISGIGELCSITRPIASTFSLADFIKESAPVIVDMKPVEIIEEMTAPQNNKIKPKELLSLPNELRASTLFDEIEIDVSKWNKFNFIEEVDKLIENKTYTMEWMDEGKTRLRADFSNVLQDMPSSHKKMKLMVIITKLQNKENTLRVLFNASFKIYKIIKYQKIKNIIEKNIFDANTNITCIKDFLDACVIAGRNWIDIDDKETMKENLTKEVINWDEYDNIYNSEQLSQNVKPFTEYQLCEILTNKYATGNDEAFETLEKKICCDENFDSDRFSDFDPEYDDDFEKVHFDECSNDDHREKKQVSAFLKSCTVCEASLSLDNAVFLNECGHNFCRECIKKNLHNQIRSGVTPLECPICQTEIPITFLPLIFPLPLVSFYINLQYVKQMEIEGVNITNCKKCKAVANIESINEYNNVNCQKCGIHWCVLCNEAPHFPLTCKQNTEWREKFNRQSENMKDININVIDNNNVISQKFFITAKEAHDLRFNRQQSARVDRAWKKLRSENSDKTFLQSRKTLLHLVEYGYAWLYMNRNNKPENYNKIKNILSGFLIELNCVDESILNNGKGNWEQLIQKIKQNIDKILNEFRN